MVAVQRTSVILRGAIPFLLELEVMMHAQKNVHECTNSAVDETKVLPPEMVLRR